MSADFWEKKKYTHILEGHFMEPKTVKSLAKVGFDITSVTFHAFVDTILIQIEDIDVKGYGAIVVLNKLRGFFKFRECNQKLTGVGGF